MALTPIAWAIATHAEAHTLHLALVAILLWLLVAWDARVRAPGEAPDRAGRARTMPSPSLAREPTSPGNALSRPVETGDRYLLAATIVFGLAVGNHSLTLLLASRSGSTSSRSIPGSGAAAGSSSACVGLLVATVVLVYLELPLRAGPFRAALVYGTPNTWDGFRYIVLAEQFQGSLSDPFGDLPRKFGELVARTVAQFGILAPLIPVAFVVTALRRPRYALLTGTAAAITCFFAASYVNADISRYYVGPALMAWTWLAILGAAVIDVLAAVGGTDPTTEDGRRPRRRTLPPPRADATARTRGSILAIVIAIALIAPTIIDVPARFRAVDASGQREAARWADHVLSVDGARRGDRQLVELLDAAVVRAPGRGQAAGHRRSSTTARASTRTSAG